MIKENKKMIILTSIITLLPMFIGIVLWSKLPDTIATHFDLNNNPNGWSSKEFTIFGLPLFMLANHVLCVFVTAKDPKNKNISRKLYTFILWICPVVSLILLISIYGYERGIDIGISYIANLIVGIIFIVIGNYLPKCRQSYTVGIKLPWTLSDEENWNRTHRFAGWIWMLGGLAMVLNTLINSEILMLTAMIVCVAIPTIYSFVIYTKNKK